MATALFSVFVYRFTVSATPVYLTAIANLPKLKGA